MYYVVLFALAGAMTYFNWGLVHAAPRTLSMLLPAKFANLIGVALLLVGVFTGVFSAYALHSPPGVLESLIQAFAGLWFILATTSAQRGSYEDEQMLRRLFVMAGLLEVVLLLTSLTDDDPRRWRCSAWRWTAGSVSTSVYRAVDALRETLDLADQSQGAQTFTDRMG